MKLLLNWAEGAEQVGPDEDPELATLWQALLGSIYRNDSGSREWLSIIKKLDEKDARLLINNPRIFVSSRFQKTGQMQRLTGLGLYEGFDPVAFMRRMSPLALMATMWVLILFSVGPIGVALFPKSEAHLVPFAMFQIPLSLLIVLFSASYIVGVLMREINKFTLTETGREIRLSALRYIVRTGPPDGAAADGLRPSSGPAVHSQSEAGSVAPNSPSTSAARRKSRKRTNPGGEGQSAD